MPVIMAQNILCLTNATAFFSFFAVVEEGGLRPKGTSSFLCEKEITISFLAFTTQSCFLGTKGLRINAPTYEHNVVIRLHVHWLHFPLVVLWVFIAPHFALILLLRLHFLRSEHL